MNKFETIIRKCLSIRQFNIANREFSLGDLQPFERQLSLFLSLRRIKIKIYSEIFLDELNMALAFW